MGIFRLQGINREHTLIDVLVRVKTPKTLLKQHGTHKAQDALPDQPGQGVNAL
ncbi:MAG: hypothetical protein IH613_15290 [Desulfuromonadales bacterium]|nr:hypothetical protein [Desulfuromonadales bacterium]